jgi:CRISPR-associated endoribonuclease Cas6
MRGRRTTSQKLKWAVTTEIVGITLHFDIVTDTFLPANYNYNFHAWFLREIEKDDRTLSAYLHDGQSEKPFTLSHLEGKLESQSHQILLRSGNTYSFTITALYPPLCQWLAKWLETLPSTIALQNAILPLSLVNISLPPQTYKQLFDAEIPSDRNISLRFITPTGFRSKGHHLPLPIPRNIFQSYLRRWKDFSGYSGNGDEFLAWIEEVVFVSRHEIKSSRATVGKQGTVTGFTGVVEFGVDRKAENHPDYERLLYALARFAPYCGTGHKTTFGLGQTRFGVELKEEGSIVPGLQTLLADRIGYLTDIFLNLKKNPDSDRAKQSASTWATIMARREMGESLQAIAQDLEMPYETAKSYCKLARRSLNLVNKFNRIL